MCYHHGRDGKTDIVQGHRCCKRVDEARRARGQHEDPHALGPHVVGQHLARVDGLHRGERKGKHGPEDVDKGDRCRRRRLAACLDVPRRRARCDGQGDGHTHGAAQEHLTPADDVVATSSNHGGDPASDGVDDVQQQLGVGVSHPDVLEQVG